MPELTEMHHAKNNLLLTQRQVAEFFGVTRARIAQLEKRALKKLRRAILADKELQDYVRWYVQPSLRSEEVNV